MSPLKTIAVLSAALLLQACAVGLKRTPFTDESVSSVKLATPYNLVIQDEVKPSVEMSNVSGAMMAGGIYGAIPALIGSSYDSAVNKKRNQNAQNIMENFYGVTDDFNYRELIAKDLNQSLSSVLPLTLKTASAEFVLLSNKERQKRIAALGVGEALIYTSSFYGFFDNSRLLVNETMVFIYTKPAKATKDTKPIFYNRFIYNSAPQGDGGESSLLLWSKDSGKLYRETMVDATKTIAEMVAFDMNAKRDKFCGKPIQASLVLMGAVNWRNTTLVEEKNNRVLVQDTSGALTSVPLASTKVNPKAKAKKCG